MTRCRQQGEGGPRGQHPGTPWVSIPRARPMTSSRLLLTLTSPGAASRLVCQRAAQQGQDAKLQQQLPPRGQGAREGRREPRRQAGGSRRRAPRTWWGRRLSQGPPDLDPDILAPVTPCFRDRAGQPLHGRGGQHPAGPNPLEAAELLTSRWETKRRRGCRLKHMSSLRPRTPPGEAVTPQQHRPLGREDSSGNPPPRVCQGRRRADTQS